MIEIDTGKEHVYGYADAILKQVSYRVAGDRAAGLATSPTISVTQDVDPRITIQETACWKKAQEMLPKESPTYKVEVKDPATNRTLSGGFYEHVEVGITGISGKFIRTNYNEMAAKIIYLCDDLKQELLDDLAKDNMNLIEKAYNIGEKTQ